MTEIPTKTADQLIDRYIAIRDHIATQSKAFDEWKKPFNEEMEAISAKLHEMLLALGGDSPKLATGSGTAYFTTTKNPRIENRDIYLKFLNDEWTRYGNAMLQLGTPQVAAVNEYMDEHEGALPPGV